MLALPELQRAFFRAVTSSSGDAPAQLLDDIGGDARLDAGARLGVYARMYRARLVDVLYEDYPRVAARLGSEGFTKLAHDYVAARPSTHPSLRWFGRGFPDFLAAEIGDRPPFLPDLARLEWTRLAVFDGPDAAPLETDALRRVPPDAWATLRLQLIPALALLRTTWPVHRIWDDDAPTVPSPSWQPAETWLRVWRQDDKVYQAGMDDTERTALACVQRGDDFATLCGALATVVSEERAAETAGGLMLRWIADGLLSAVTLPA